MEDDIDIEPLKLDFDTIDDGIDDLKAVVDHAHADLAEIGPLGHFAPPETTDVDPRGLWDKAVDFMFDKFLPEVGDMLDHKIAQGAAELGQALNHDSTAYTPYGYGQQALEIEGPLQSYTDALHQSAEPESPDQDLKMGM